ncbi:hypothetical protein QEZ52_20760 (plasmid) [Aliisedimentitalea scapharcae]|uniref:HEAT repeat domain-containing protein n=1 Tax=Aliisedimentitalea scapharcae TaxID=1524259 RepID=A0ABZ2XYN3_9RHOB
MNKITVSFLLAVGLIVPNSATPCGFHNYAPQPTLVDRLLGSDEIVLARSAPNNPFRFEAIEALEGNLGSSEIPFLVDSVTRHRFAMDAQTAVLFARDGDYGPWQRLALVDATMAPVLSTIMEQLPAWEIGSQMDRFRYFATLLNHPDDRIHKMALRELDQADYATLRSLNLAIETRRLQARLDEPNEADFKAIRILLLGMSDDLQFRDLLEAGVENNVRSEGIYLGAYATALIELVGPEAVASIAAKHLTNSNHSLLSRELLIEAVALHGGSTSSEMETSVMQAINSSLWLDPRLAGAAARQFGARGNWSLAPVLKTLLEEGTVFEMADRQDASQYVIYAQEFKTQP